jgi:hypothetical protein
MDEEREPILEDSVEGEMTEEDVLIEEVLKEMAESGVPEDVPLAELPGVEGGIAPPPCEPSPVAAEPEPPPRFENPVEYADTREIAVAEPMTAHDATLVALGDNVRQVSTLIENIGRTLEAQNQRTLNLMDRLEKVAKCLETMPDEADRGLEGLDAIEEAVKAHKAPLEALSERLGALPDVVAAMNKSNETTKELWSVATRALAGRMAYTAHEERVREQRERGQRRWRVIGGAALALAAFVAGTVLSSYDVGGTVKAGIASVLADGPVANADQGERTWHVTDVKQAAPAPAPEAPAVLPVPPVVEEWFGIDEEEGGC